MELQSIGSVSKQFNISLRTLRYYESIGLVHSTKKAESSYRYYDEDAIWRIRQVVVLRKLRIPLKQIIDILQRDDSLAALHVFEQSISEISDEITALSTIRDILHTLIERIRPGMDFVMKQVLLEDDMLLDVVDSLTVSKINFKETKAMDDLDKASKKLLAVAGSEIRIVYLPPATVASILSANDSVAEDTTWHQVNQFIRDNDIARVKPDFRHYAFDNNHGEEHGFERWITIPDDMEVKVPFTKKRFAGGLYGARTINFSAVVDWREEWNVLIRWVMEGGEYEYEAREPMCNNGLLEEHLNYMNRYTIDNASDKALQIDLLMPAKPKKAVE